MSYSPLEASRRVLESSALEPDQKAAILERLHIIEKELSYKDMELSYKDKELSAKEQIFSARERELTSKLSSKEEELSYKISAKDEVLSRLQIQLDFVTLEFDSNGERTTNKKDQESSAIDRWCDDNDRRRDSWMYISSLHA